MKHETRNMKQETRNMKQVDKSQVKSKKLIGHET